MARIDWEPIVLDGGSSTATTGGGPAQLSEAPARDSRTVTLAAYGLPGGSVDRFLGSDVTLLGESMTVTPAYRVGSEFRLDLENYDGESTAVDWLVDLTVKDRTTGARTVYHLATRGGWSDSAAVSNAARSYRILTPTFDPDAGKLSLSAAGDEAAMERLVSDARMLGLGYGISFNESGTDADGRVYAAHSADFEPSTTFRVDVIFKVYAFDGAAKTLLIKGTGLGNPQFALFIGAGGDLRFRMRNSGGTAVTVVKFSPILEVDTIYHATGVWDGAELRVAVNGEFNTSGIPSFTTAAAGLTDDLHLGVAPSQAGTLLNGEIYYAAVYVDGLIDLDTIRTEAYGFSLSDSGLVAEWLLDEGSGDRSDNRTDPDQHPLTVENLTAAWEPWVYSKTGAVGDAGTLWPLPLGFAQIEPHFAVRAEGLKAETIAHTCIPFVKYETTAATDSAAPQYYQQLEGVDRIMAGGEALRVEVTGIQVEITTGTDGPGGWFEDVRYENQEPFAHPTSFRAVPVPGQQIELLGAGGGIDGVHTVRSVTRSGKNRYARRIYLEAPGITSAAPNIFPVLYRTVGTFDVSFTADGILHFQSRPTTRVIVSGWWSGGFGQVTQWTPGVVAALIEARAGAVSAPDLAATLSPWEEVGIGALWTGKTVKEALVEILGSLGVTAAYSSTPDGVEVSRLTATDPGGVTAATFTDANTRELSVIREVGAVGAFGCSYRRRGDVYAEADFTAVAQQALTDADWRWLTSPSQQVISGESPEFSARGALSEELIVTPTVLIDAAQARRTANYDLSLLNAGYYVVKVKTAMTAASLKLRRDQVYVQSNTHPALKTGAYGRIIAAGNEGRDAVLYLWLQKEDAS